jgi:hypothetical protein
VCELPVVPREHLRKAAKMYQSTSRRRSDVRFSNRSNPHPAPSTVAKKYHRFKPKPGDPQEAIDATLDVRASARVRCNFIGPSTGCAQHYPQRIRRWHGGHTDSTASARGLRHHVIPPSVVGGFPFLATLISATLQ